jgi:hypothetical protein
MPSGTVNTRSRGGSTEATTKASVARGTAGMMSPGTTVWSSGTTRFALGVPPLSMVSQLYHPARPAPICAIHGQTWSGAASIVMAWVDVKSGTGTIASTGSGRRCSNAVALQVANGMTQWEEHLLYRNERKAGRRKESACQHPRG